MNQRAKKKVEKNRRRKLTELFDLALQANSLECRSRRESGNLPTVFLDFSGHVSLISIRVFENGWISAGDCEEVDLNLDYRYREKDYQEAKELLMQALAKAGKQKPQQ